MSNLTLPSLAHRHLMAQVPDGASRKIGYETLAAREGDTVTVYHHNSIIATLSPDEIHISNAGYGSSTTRARIHKVLLDNMGNRFGVTQQNYDQVLFEFPREGAGKRVEHRHFHTASFAGSAGSYFELATFNGQPVSA